VSDNETVREETVQADETSSTFDQAFDAALSASDSDQAESEATETEAEPESAETSADDADEEATPPTAEELGVDTSTPEGKRQFKALLSKWTAWQNRHAAKTKAAPEPPAPAQEAAPAQPAASSDDDPIIDGFYKLDFSTFKPSDDVRAKLSEYDDGLVDVLESYFNEKLQHTLEGMKANDRTLRQTMARREQEGNARSVIEKYAAEIKDHPDLTEKTAELQQLATRYRQVAIDDPELFVEIVERKTGLERGWRGEAEATQRRAGQENQRIADKRLASVPRPTRAPARGGDARGDMTFDSALDAAMRKAGVL
jgi:phage baseplate assembly protein gpV